MKNLDIDIVLKESFYLDCESPVLPIPFSEDDINTMLNGGVSMSVIADNLLQMIDQHPTRIAKYKPLIVFSCLNAGGTAADEGNHILSNYYFLLASDFAPDDMAVRQNLAYSYQHLHRYEEAIDNYLFVLNNSDHNTGGLLETAVCVIECYFNNGDSEAARQLTRELIINIGSQANGSKMEAWATIIDILNRDNADKTLQDYFFELKNFYKPSVAGL
jgi:tetratricopeptide (TPR) repeat protein